MAGKKKPKKAAKKNKAKKRKKRPGYLDQLNRARRFLERMKAATQGEEFQDMAWAFFQNCWHVKDWLRNDRRVPNHPNSPNSRCSQMAHASAALKICKGICNGTKHLIFDHDQHEGSEHYLAITMPLAPVGVADNKPNEFDFVIHKVDPRFASGKKLADECIAEWVHILRSEGFDTTR
jgi:hypothetical protein